MPVPRPDPRFLSLCVLAAIVADGRELEEAFAREKALERLEPRDRQFVRQLVMSVLKRYGEWQALLERYVSHMPKEPSLRLIMMLGAAQLLDLQTPPHAAVSTSVSLAKKQGFVRQSGMVNAVLKKIAALVPETRPDEAVRNLPVWLASRLTQAYGADRARAIAEAHRLRAPLDLTVKSGPASWASRLSATPLPSGSLRREPADVTSLEGYGDGEWWVQDAAAALPALLLGDVRGKQVLDLCAAPGGKTMQLAASGGIVTAVDRSGRRIERLRENLARTGLSASVVQADLREYTPERRFGAVLLDAPCTATGTLRRHPDVALHRAEADISAMAALQSTLLDRAAEWVEPGGVFAYAVCSLLTEEGEAQADAFEARHPGWQRVCERPARIPAEWFDGGRLRTLPCYLPEQGGMDGFFACAWRRDA